MEPQPGIDKKAVAAILLCAVIWAVWMNMNYRRNQQLAAQQRAAKQGGAVTTGTAGQIAQPGTALPAGTAAPVGSGVAAASAPAESRVVTLENGVLSLHLSSAGARPVSAELKAFTRVDEKGKSAFVGMVSGEIPEAPAFAPLAPWFGDDRDSLIPASAPFAVLSTNAGSVVFRWQRPDGLALTRTYKTDGDRYTLDLVEEIANGSSAPVSARPGVLWAAPERSAREATDLGELFTAAAHADRFNSKKAKNPSTPVVFGGRVDYVAIHDRYFAAAVAPTDPVFDAADSVRLVRPAPKSMAALALAEKVTLAPGEKKTLHHRLYLGPKDYDVLRGIGNRFDWLMDWGRLTVLVKGLWHALRWFHGLVGNWGVAIMMLTLVMRGLLWPLAARQMRTANEFSGKVQKLKPQLDRLREKHSEDPMEMNRQTMLLYKQHGVSPFSPLTGCLPLLLQLPIWWALYRVLWTSIDLRGAPLGLWIHDLSVADPWRILPVLLGAVTWLQMKLTPSAGADPVQQKMMQWMMPVMFTFFMWSLPSGLVVYIFTSTLMGILQQWLLKRQMPNVETVPPGAEATR